MFRLLMGFRTLALVLGLGTYMIGCGYDNLVLSQGTSAEPVDVSLEQIEAGSVPESAYWNIGPHLAMTHVGVYQYSRKRGSTDEPGPRTPITYFYYPIFSTGHPYVAQTAAMVATYGTASVVPPQAWPATDDFTVLVKTRRFATVGAIPGYASEERKIQGMAINRVVRLADDERAELTALFPTLNLDKVVVLEEGRTPVAAITSISTMAGGGLVFLAIPLWVLFRARRGFRGEGRPSLA